MSGRMQRVKDAIASTLHEVEANIKTIHEQGQTAPLDMIGFRNGLAIADHAINMREEKCVLIDIDPRRKSRIAEQEANGIADEQEYEYLMDQILQQGRAVCWTTGDEHSDAVKVLGEKILDLDKFIEAKMKDEAGKAEVTPAPDAGSDNQVGSTSHPGPLSNESGEALFTSLFALIGIACYFGLALLVFYYIIDVLRLG